jgi:hypothetical protein
MMNIQIRKSGDDPSFARIIIADPNWGRDFSKIQMVFHQIYMNWPKGLRVQFLLTSSGFIDFDWIEPGSKIIDNWNPDSNYVEELRLLAEGRCKSLITDELRSKLYSCADYLSIGIESEKFKKTLYPDCWPAYSHIEFVALIDLKNNQYHWTGKSYPQSEQVRGLIRNSDISNHFIKLPQGNILILACHDLVMEYPRGIKSSNPGGRRDKIRREFESTLHIEKPTTIIHHAHTSNDSLIWRTAFNHVLEIAPFIQKFISTGIFSAPTKDGAGIRLMNTLLKTTNGDSLNFIVTPEDVFLDLPVLVSDKPIKVSKQQKITIIESPIELSFKTLLLAPDEEEVFREIVRWSVKRGLGQYWSPAGSFYPVYSDAKSDMNNLISITRKGIIHIQLKYITQKSPFDTDEKRKNIIYLFNSIPGVQIKMEQVRGLPSFPIKVLINPLNLNTFLMALDSIIAELQKATTLPKKESKT